VLSIAQELQTYLEVVLQYEKQIQQYELQLQQYQNMVQNTNDLPHAAWTDIPRTLGGIYEVLQRGRSIANQAGNLEVLFTRMFPNYLTMLATPVTPISFQTSYQTWSDNTQQGLQTSISAAGQALSQRAADQARLSSLEDQAAGVDGNLRAVKAAAAVATESVVQLQQLKMLLSQNAAAQNQYYAQVEATEALERAATQQALSGTSPAFGSGKRY